MARAYGGISPEQRRAERRAKLLQAGLALFTSTGFAGTKISGLCTEAGVSTRNFYEEFASKEDLLRDLHDLINATAFTRVRTALAELETDDVRVRITALLDVFVRSVTADPRAPRLNYVEAVGVNAEIEQQHVRWVNTWAEFIESEALRAAAAGVAPQRSYRLTAIALVGAITGLLREWQAHRPPLAVDEIAEEIRELMLAAVLRPHVPQER
ncbi:TetR/AcrR family transcriptional regulator [Lentzea flaviverrucosa]|uniref:Transcriptional regulator, TetR family n=1 Tax=Lentzea flaviverrucosa TaxID=200379 RepID=A0A1H9G853_9PSEU|nr:TetR/AcrR family transcriptional regulator [Lentzea flaviverrucosa]RDI34986.1 TetR family transcriptional regulator [Lentzea flaviverrucosa]SEQ46244.1 transcriptional regulator, TetR family [Lentzea flaviverrucosa]